MPFRNLPQRFREPRFWHVQALVALATVPHYFIDSSEQFTVFDQWQLNSLVISLYLLPLLYAALNYSWEGAVLTGLWVAALTSPSIWYWGRGESHYLTEIGQLVVTLPVGLLVAWRVDIEAKHRRRAEKASASLSLLNQTGEALSKGLEAEEQVPLVLRTLLSGLPLDSSWLCLDTDPQCELSVNIVLSDEGGSLTERLPRELHRRTAATRVPQVQEGYIAVPLLTEDRLFGSLGAAMSGGSSPTDEQTEVLATVARQLCAAVVNARLYHERQTSMQSYVRHVTEAQEEERLRISRELHDETAQELVHLVRGLEQIRDYPDITPAASVDELIEGTREAIKSVRRFSRDLRPSVLDDLGLTAAIEAIVEDTDAKLPGGAVLRVTGEVERVAEPVEVALFRVAQESLRNVEKHARATSAAVELDFKPDATTLSVSDDGAGFDASRSVSDLARAGKLGLVGMKERCKLVGGSFDLQSSPSEGTHVTVAVRNGGSARDVQQDRPSPGTDSGSHREAPRVSLQRPTTPESDALRCVAARRLL
jgi:signal transduction histidine kinase